tara:strand:+ start:1684 stop:2331 length:648 start_codon:yes stop_codon:yes gene_type:complete
MKKIILEKIKKIPTLYFLLKQIFFFIIHFLSIYKWRLIKSKKEILLNLGSGPIKGKNNWITVDLYGADINHDLRKGIPMKDNTVDKIYTSHMFEHIPFNQLTKFIKECYRVLKVGGELSVCVPNARLYIDSYINKKIVKNEEDMFAPAVIKTGSWIDQLNYIAYLGGLHHYMFDEENLVNTLKLSPFKNVEIRDFDISIDKERRKRESIYASAIK